MHPESWTAMRETGSEGRWLGGQMGPCSPQTWGALLVHGLGCTTFGCQDAGLSGLPYGGRQGQAGSGPSGLSLNHTGNLLVGWH